jgi:hypothetical protein
LDRANLTVDFLTGCLQYHQRGHTNNVEVSRSVGMSVSVYLDEYKSFESLRYRSIFEGRSVHRFAGTTPFSVEINEYELAGLARFAQG